MRTDPDLFEDEEHELRDAERFPLPTKRDIVDDYDD